MHRFTIAAKGDCSLNLACWEAAGFMLLSNQTDFSNLDVLALSSDNLATEFILAERPKVFITNGCCPLSPDLTEIYSSQVWLNNALSLTVATRLEAPLPPPLWADYQDQQEKAAADTVYRHLLNDVFRETAEWCGHMSSVVRWF